MRSTRPGLGLNGSEGITDTMSRRSGRTVRQVLLGNLPRILLVVFLAAWAFGLIPVDLNPFERDPTLDPRTDSKVVERIEPRRANGEQGVVIHLHDRPTIRVAECVEPGEPSSKYDLSGFGRYECYQVAETVNVTVDRLFLATPELPDRRQLTPVARNGSTATFATNTTTGRFLLTILVSAGNRTAGTVLRFNITSNGTTAIGFIRETVSKAAFRAPT